MRLSLSIGCQFALYDSCYNTSSPTLFMPLKEDSTTNVAVIDVNEQKNKSLIQNISLCQIASLEVYRGKDSIVEINHSGFTLTDRNTIKV